jgi:long-subunit acyl-CoA synthetase (AMP-forming)
VLLIPPIKPSSAPSSPINKAAQTALEAAKKENVPVYEMWLGDIGLQTKHVFGNQRNKQRKTVLEVGNPHTDDVALVLHTSGTTGR